MAGGILLAFATAFLIPANLLNARPVQEFVKAVAFLVPAVDVMSARATDTVRAQITWAVQWALFPVYLFIWIKSFRPWGTRAKPRPVRRPPDMSGTKMVVVTLLGLFFCGALILSDFRIISFPGFLNGRIFEGDPSTLPALLGAPFASTLSMLFYAWLIPLGNSMCYWIFLVLALNFFSFLREAQRPG